MSPLLASLHWLSLNPRIVFKIHLRTYKVFRGQTPSWLEELQAPYHPNSLLRSRDAGLLVVSSFKGTMSGTSSLSRYGSLVISISLFVESL